MPMSGAPWEPGPSSAPVTAAKCAAADHQRAAEARGGAGELGPHRDDARIGARQGEAVAEVDEEAGAEEGRGLSAPASRNARQERPERRDAAADQASCGSAPSGRRSARRGKLPSM